jgi:hypothetical protein
VPNIKGVIPGEGIIEGRFTVDQARAFAKQLNDCAKAHGGTGARGGSR